MMQLLNWISDFLQTVVDTIVSIFSFFLNLIMGLLNFLKLLPTYISYVTLSVGFLPSFLTVFASATIAIAVIYVILGRGGKE